MGWTLIVEAAANLRLQNLAEQHRMNLATVRLPDRRSPGVVLVRPDGHVALRARPDDLSALEAYVDRWFNPTIPNSLNDPPYSAQTTSRSGPWKTRSGA